MTVRIALDDAALFGNDAAEDEDEDIFASYAYHRPEVSKFQTSAGLLVARAYKGEGKSALLRLAATAARADRHEAIVAEVRGPAITPAPAAQTFDAWVKAWKLAMLAEIAGEVGARINHAFQDDTISLLELAERKGFRSRSLISAVTDRLKTPPVTRDRPEPGDLGRLLQRWQEDKQIPIWLFVDDLDRNFENNRADRLKLVGFFDAARGLVAVVPQLRIRTAIRPNVWLSLKREFEGLSHAEQYCVELRWTERDMLELLARRVEAYLARSGQVDARTQDRENQPSGSPEDGRLRLVALAFDGAMEWGGQGNVRPPHVLIDTLSSHRPRWLVELCKVAATRAVAEQATKISKEHILEELEAFGRRRIDDTVAEFSSVCPQVAELIEAFRGQKEEYSTAELASLIDHRILSHLTPSLPNVAGRPKALDVAQFLFEIGFLFGRKDLENRGPRRRYVHVGFVERPTLLDARTSADALKWEIPPTFRQALDLRDVRP